MGGYYIPSSFSANYIGSKKNEDGTYVYDTAVNKAGIDAQRSLSELGKQYNVTINQAYGNSLFANRGLRASMLGSGYKDAYVQNLQKSVLDELSQANLSVQSTKQSIFQQLGADLTNIGQAQQQEVNNMRRFAGSLEQYYGYLKTLMAGGTYYVDDAGFKVGDEYTFEDNYDKIFGTQKGIISKYVDETNTAGLSWEDWVRKNSGNTDEDTAWLDWLYNGGSKQYQDFIKNGINTIY